MGKAMNDEATIPETYLLPRRRAPLRPGGPPALTWLDVGPDGRILSLDPAICRLAAAQLECGDVFSLQPEGAFFRALEAANRLADPAPTILHPADLRTHNLRQVNVLPVAPGRIRIVLFVDPPDTRAGAAAAPHLTPREMAVLSRLAAGLRRDRIAWELNISLPTVDMHARNLRQKLDALTTSEAVANAARHGLIRV